MNKEDRPLIMQRYENSSYKPTEKALQEFDKVIEEFSKGKQSLTKCIDMFEISPPTFYSIVKCLPESFNKLTHARESYNERKADTVIDISEDTSLSVEERKLRIYAIEKSVQLSDPKRYRDKIDTQINIQTNSDVVRFEIPEDGREKRE